MNGSLEMRKRGARVRFMNVAAAAAMLLLLLVACAREPGTGGSEVSPNPPTAPAVTEGGEIAAKKSAEFLARELGVAVTGLQVISTAPMTWSDAGLGCPQPGMMYAQVLTPGYLVIIRDDGGREHQVHTDEDVTAAVVCQQQQ